VAALPHPALGQDFESIEPPLGPSDQWHQRMVQTGNALIRSHRRSASSLASMMFQLRAQAVALSPPARQVQAQASDETTAS
jgi:hypothetical protein